MWTALLLASALTATAPVTGGGDAARPVPPPPPPASATPWHHMSDQSVRPATDAAATPPVLSRQRPFTILRFASPAPTPCHSLDLEVRGDYRLREMWVRGHLVASGICAQVLSRIDVTTRIPALDPGEWIFHFDLPEFRASIRTKVP